MQKQKRNLRKSVLLVVMGLLSGCVAEEATEPAQTQDEADTMAETLSWTPVSFAEMPGWEEQNWTALRATFAKSCAKIARKAKDQPLDPKWLGALPYGTAGDWHPICDQLTTLPDRKEMLKAFLEETFQPLLVTDAKQTDGLYTGYYEPEINASRQKTARHTTPFLSPPPDLKSVDLGRFDPALKGKTIRGRVSNGTFIPYHDRQSIERGALETEALALAWAEDPVDVFFAHIQGSTRLKLTDGTAIRLAFAAKNGRPYRAIGRDLVARGAIPQDQISMQSIRQWLADHPQQRQELLDLNPSFIFFREVAIEDPSLGPPGAAGIPLTPLRSLAVDRSIHPLGALLWIDTQIPSEQGQVPFRQLMVAQDTGSAIKGAVRGDIYFGTGTKAGERAGRMAQPGRMITLIPKSILAKTSSHTSE